MAIHISTQVPAFIEEICWLYQQEPEHQLLCWAIKQAEYDSRRSIAIRLGALQYKARSIDMLSRKQRLLPISRCFPSFFLFSPFIPSQSIQQRSQVRSHNRNNPISEATLLSCSRL